MRGGSGVIATSTVSASGSVATPQTSHNARGLTPGISVVVVLGATGVGKTTLAIEIALALNGEIVNADSRYFYRGMNIGTAKPTLDEQRGVPHHLIDILSPVDPFSIAAYLDLAYPAIESISAHGRLAVVAGGTPQYLRALIEGWRAPAVAPDEAYRRTLANTPAAALHVQLQAVDPASAERIDPHNQRRLMRALEVVRATGAPVSVSESKSPPPYRFHLLGLRQPRELLRARVDARVRDMFTAGWLTEVERLRARGATAATPAMSAHGYREALAVVEGTMTIADAIDQTQRMVRRYIRHQETWFRRFEAVNWFDTSNGAGSREALQSAFEFAACVRNAE